MQRYENEENVLLQEGSCRCIYQRENERSWKMNDKPRENRRERKREDKLEKWIEIEAESGFSSIQLVTVIAIVNVTKII